MQKNVFVLIFPLNNFMGNKTLRAANCNGLTLNKLGLILGKMPDYKVCVC